jgi:CBS domain-containing protein
MAVGQICRRDVVTATPDETVLVAARRMRDHHVGSIVVVADGRPSGILCDRDLAVRVVAEGRDPAQTRVGDVMTAAPTTVPGWSSFEYALGRMRTSGCRRLPVVDDARNLIGIVTLDDLIALLAQDLATAGCVLEHQSPAHRAA